MYNERILYITHVITQKMPMGWGGENAIQKEEPHSLLSKPEQEGEVFVYHVDCPP